MHAKRLCLCPVAALLLMLPVVVLAQSLPQNIPQSLRLPSSQSNLPADDQYIPLFTPEQIAKAAKESRKRMQATEKMNHEAWVKRRKDRAAVKARTQAPAAASPPPPKYTRKGKIYKWVDAQGRVHFGDAPSGKNSQQIKLRNTSPPKGAPPPATPAHLQNRGEDS